VGHAGERSERPFQYLFRYKAFIGGCERWMVGIEGEGIY
jgi:hypothetical protein